MRSVKVDVWELRCRFNRGRFWERLQAHEFTAQVKSRAASQVYRLGPGGLSQEVYYIDPGSGDQVARVHQLVKADGTLGGGGKPDPKELLVNGTRYHLHSGFGPTADRKRDPSLGFSVNWLRSGYKLWRRLKCRIIGR
jgi:hypothetical protein